MSIFDNPDDIYKFRKSWDEEAEWYANEVENLTL